MRFNSRIQSDTIYDVEKLEGLLSLDDRRLLSASEVLRVQSTLVICTLHRSDCFDLYIHVIGQLCCLDTSTSGFRSRQQLFIHFVHTSKVIHALQVHIDLDNVLP